MGRARLYLPSHDNAASEHLPETPKGLRAADLVKVMTDKPITPHPSTLKSLPPEELTSIVIPKPKRQRQIPERPRAEGYNEQAYTDAKHAAEEKKDPTSRELDDLFRLMEFDSQRGELLQEAYAIWKEMRSRGIIPTDRGYAALLKVSYNPDVVDCRWLPK